VSRRKTAQQKKKTGSKNVPKKQKTVADQIQLVAPAGLPDAPALIDGDTEAIAIYNQLGGAIMRYESLFQGIDTYTLAIASLAYKRYSFCSKIANDPLQAFVEESKSHCAKDPETGKMPVTIKEHPAVKMARDAQSDFFAALKTLGLDLKGRSEIMVKMTMVKAIHGNGATVHPAGKYFVLEA
jgi:phage terminase small subunit